MEWKHLETVELPQHSGPEPSLGPHPEVSCPSMCPYYQRACPAVDGEGLGAEGGLHLQGVSGAESGPSGTGASMVLPCPGQQQAPPLVGDQEGTDLGERLGKFQEPVFHSIKIMEVARACGVYVSI